MSRQPTLVERYLAEFVGTLTNPAAPTQMTGTYTVTGGLCDGDSGTGTLTKQ